MSQTDGLGPTNHPIGWSAIRLIRAISHLEEQLNAERGIKLTQRSGRLPALC